MKRFKAGIVQFDVRLGDVGRNVSVVKRQIRALAGRGAKLIVLPEMWSSGFANERLAVHAEATPQVLHLLASLSEQEDVTIIGSLPERADGGVYNTAYLVDRGQVRGSYRKVHLFTPTGEGRYFLSGDEATVARTRLGVIGVMICYDLRFPELCRRLVLLGASMIVVVAQWPAVRTAHWDVLLRARAIENQAFVLGANRSGRDEDLVYAGHSRIVSPTGDVLARGDKRSGTMSATIDPSLVDRVRKEIPCLKQRVPEAYV